MKDDVGAARRLDHSFGIAGVDLDRFGARLHVGRGAAPHQARNVPSGGMKGGCRGAAQLPGSAEHEDAAGAGGLRQTVFRQSTLQSRTILHAGHCCHGRMPAASGPDGVAAGRSPMLEFTWRISFELHRSAGGRRRRRRADPRPLQHAARRLAQSVAEADALAGGAAIHRHRHYHADGLGHASLARFAIGPPFGVIDPVERSAGARQRSWRRRLTMVVLNRIYTRTGDDGTTALGTGERRKKYDLRVDAYGTSTRPMRRSAWRGCTPPATPRSMPCWPHPERPVRSRRRSVHAGRRARARRRAARRVTEAQVGRLEGEIDRLNAELAPLRSFVLPGGTPAAAYLHLARTICRRAERMMVELADQPGESVSAAGAQIRQPAVGLSCSSPAATSTQRRRRRAVGAGPEPLTALAASVPMRHSCRARMYAAMRQSR